MTMLGNGELPFAVTLNSVEKTQDLGEETREGDEFYLIGDFTFENLGDESFKIEKPNAAKGSDESAIENDELDSKGDLLGIGSWFLDENGKIDVDGNPTNTSSVDPGEKKSQKIAINMRGSADEYMIVFGFFDGKNKYYQNKVAWTFDPDEVE